MFKKIKNNKATIMMSRVICYLMLVIALAFSTDIIILMTQHVVTSYQAAYYGEKIAIQGGLLGNSRKLSGPINSLQDCTSCLSNPQLSEKISKNFRHFGLSQHDWEAYYIDSDGNRLKIHSGGGSSSIISELKYMNIGYFELTTLFEPRVSAFLWADKKHLITKKVPIVSEYIPK